MHIFLPSAYSQIHLKSTNSAESAELSYTVVACVHGGGGAVLAFAEPITSLRLAIPVTLASGQMARALPG